MRFIEEPYTKNRAGTCLLTAPKKRLTKEKIFLSPVEVAPEILILGGAFSESDGNIIQIVWCLNNFNDFCDVSIYTS